MKCCVNIVIRHEILKATNTIDKLSNIAILNFLKIFQNMKALIVNCFYYSS